MTLPVKYYANTMQGAPQLTNDWGCMTALLDAVLVTGFNLKTIETLTSAAGVATANSPAGHLYWVGQVLAISGADQNEYNGEVRVVAVTTSTFTYAITGTPVSPATGASITSKVAPLGWEIAFTATNKRAYRNKNVLSNRPYLRVDDSCDPAYTTTYAKKAKVTMAQGMSDIDTFVGARAPFDSAYPTRNEVATGSGAGVYDGWYKWYYARSDGNAYDHYGASVFNRPWTLVGDDRGFYIFNDTWSSGGLGGKCFTDFESYRSADGFNTLLCAQETYQPASMASSTYDSEGYQSADWRSRFPRTLDGTGKILMRSYLQIGNNVNPSFTSLNTNMETGEIARVLGMHAGDQLLGREAFLFGAQHDRCAMGVVGADEPAFVAAHFLEAGPDVGLDVLDQVAEMDCAIGIGERAGNEDLAGHDTVFPGAGGDRMACRI